MKSQSFGTRRSWIRGPTLPRRLKGSAIDKEFYDEHRNKMVEYIAEHDDEVIDKYLTEGTLTLEEMRKSIRKSTLALKDRSGAGGFRVQEQRAFSRCSMRSSIICRRRWMFRRSKA